MQTKIGHLGTLLITDSWSVWHTAQPWLFDNENQSPSTSPSMSFTNLYKPPPPRDDRASEHVYGPEPYDLNFVFPLRWEVLENDVVKLTPFVPRTRRELYWQKLSPAREALMQHISTTCDSLLDYVQYHFRADLNYAFLAIIH